MDTSNQGIITTSYGGVANNIATTICYLKAATEQDFLSFITVFGNDQQHISYQKYCKQHDISSIVTLINPNQSSCIYMAIYNELGQLITTIANMNCIHYLTSQRSIDIITQYQSTASKLLVLDGNLLENTLQAIINHFSPSLAILYEPTSYIKTLRIQSSWSKIHFITPNLAELYILYYILTTKKAKAINVLKQPEKAFEQQPEEKKKVLEQQPEKTVLLQ